MKIKRIQIKKAVQVSSILIGIFSLIFSCKKVSFQEMNDTSNLPNQIREYLNNQIKNSSQANATNIKDILSKTDLKSSTFNSFIKNENVILANVNGINVHDFIKISNLTVNSPQTMGVNQSIVSGKTNSITKAVFYYKNNKITNGSLIEVSSTDDSDYINANFSKIISGNLKFTGTISINSFSKKLINEISFVGGKLKSSKSLISKFKKTSQNNSSNVNLDIVCTDWYLVTTWYNPDGSIDDQSDDYINTTCGEDLGGGGGTGNSSNNQLSDTTNPCQQAKSLANDTSFTNILKSLRDSTSLNYEIGYTLTTDAYGNFLYTKITGTANSASIDLSNLNYKINGLLHDHYTGTLSTFSPEDLRTLYRLLTNNYMVNPTTFTYGVVTASGTVSLLQIADFNAFWAFGDKWLKDDVSFNAFEALSTAFFDVSFSNSQNESGFLKMINIYNMGLIQMDGNPTNFQTWSNANVDANGNVISTPCP